MKLVELLDKAMETGNILYSENSELSMRYCKDIDCFMSCDLESGKFISGINGVNGCSMVLLTGNILESDDWVLIICSNSIKIGDKFFLGDIIVKITDSNGNIITKSHRYAEIGEVIHIHPYGDGEITYYELKIDGVLDKILLDGKELLKYPRVHSN